MKTVMKFRQPYPGKNCKQGFSEIKPDSRTILTLFSEGFSYHEIASKMNLKNETYARRKKYLSKEALIELDEI